MADVSQFCGKGLKNPDGPRLFAFCDQINKTPLFLSACSRMHSDKLVVARIGGFGGAPHCLKDVPSFFIALVRGVIALVRQVS